jgi:hypothetical protein
MRATRVITGAVVLLFALSACGQADQAVPANNQPAPTTPSSTAPSSPASPGPPTSGLPQGAVLVPSDRLDTSALPEYYRERKVWVLNEGRTLQLSVMARDACTGVTAIVAEQNDKLVHVAVNPMDVPQGGSPDGPGMCAQVLTPKIVTVDLKAPLGDRKVVVTEG